jgi:hypothetical protein
MLVNCGVLGEGGEGCEWFVPPAEPGSAGAARQERASKRYTREVEKSGLADRIEKKFRALEGSGSGG